MDGKEMARCYAQDRTIVLILCLLCLGHVIHTLLALPCTLVLIVCATVDGVEMEQLARILMSACLVLTTVTPLMLPAQTLQGLSLVLATLVLLVMAQKGTVYLETTV